MRLFLATPLLAILGLAQQTPTDLDRVRAGSLAPSFTLSDPAGKSHSLASFRGKNVVLVFYRGHW
jgi:cytochrome oxidase Cu insertion factor (SCO1/SenC/PrrC family)